MYVFAQRLWRLSAPDRPARRFSAGAFGEGRNEGLMEEGFGPFGFRPLSPTFFQTPLKLILSLFLSTSRKRSIVNGADLALFPQ